MVVLGIDPGFRFAGFGVLKKEGGKAFLLDYGYLALPQSAHLAERTEIFYSTFKAKIEQFGVTHLALETPFLGKNTQTFLKLGYLRGILYLLTAQYKLELFEFAPRQVKMALTGFGGASKEQVATVIMRLFPKIAVPKKEDVTDALAVTVCGLWHEKTKHLAGMQK